MNHLDDRIPTPVATMLLATLILAALILSGRSANILAITDDGPNILVFENPLEAGFELEIDIIGGRANDVYDFSILVKLDGQEAWTPVAYWRTEFLAPASPGPIRAKIRNKEGNIDEFIFLAAAVETSRWQLEPNQPRLIEDTGNHDYSNREGQANFDGSSSNTKGSGDFGWLTHPTQVIPEPKPVALVMMGLALLAFQRRRR